MQSVSSRIWTRVAVSISYDDNHYTTDSSDFMPVIILSGFTKTFTKHLGSFDWEKQKYLIEIKFLLNVGRLK